MRISLRLKLFIVLLLVAAGAVAGMAIFAQWSFEKGFVRLVETRHDEQVALVVARLAEEHAEAGSWQRVREDRGRWVAILFAGRSGDGARVDGARLDDARLPRFALRLAERDTGECDGFELHFERAIFRVWHATPCAWQLANSH